MNIKTTLYLGSFLFLTSMYKSIIRPLFFSFDPEKIHHFTFSWLRFSGQLGLGDAFRNFYKIENEK